MLNKVTLSVGHKQISINRPLWCFAIVILSPSDWWTPGSTAASQALETSNLWLCMLYEVSFILDLPDFCWHFPWGWKFWQFWKFGHFNIYWKVQIFCADATSPLWTCHGHITFYFFQLEVWSKKKRTFCIDPSWWKPNWREKVQNSDYVFSI